MSGLDLSHHTTKLGHVISAPHVMSYHSSFIPILKNLELHEFPARNTLDQLDLGNPQTDEGTASQMFTVTLLAIHIGSCVSADPARHP